MVITGVPAAIASSGGKPNPLVEGRVDHRLGVLIEDPQLVGRDGSKVDKTFSEEIRLLTFGKTLSGPRKHIRPRLAQEDCLAANCVEKAHRPQPAWAGSYAENRSPH